MINLRNIFVVLATSLFMLSMLNTLTLVSAGKNVIHVYQGQKIQDAVNAATSGDTIIIHTGTYQEQVDVSKTLTLLGIGAVIETPDIYGVNVQAVGVTVSGFRIQPLQDSNEHHCGVHFGAFYFGGVASNNEIYPGFFYGIAINGPSGIKVYDNEIHSSTHGVFVFQSTSTDIEICGNVIHANEFGIWMCGPKAKIFGNVIYSGPNGYGINILETDKTTILNNKVYPNNNIGIHLMGTNSLIINNLVSGYFPYNSGIAIEGESSLNTVFSNTILGRDKSGIGIHLGFETSNNYIILNKISNVATTIIDEGTGNIIKQK